MKKIITDVFYDEYSNNAHVAGVIFENWNDAEASDIVQFDTTIKSEYISGQFYKREMPCLIELLEKLDLSQYDTIIVDGFYNLGEAHSGLGQHLYEDYLVGKGYENIHVIGICKSYMFKCEKFATSVKRPGTKHDLYVNGNRKDVDYAQLINSMDGEHRIPTLIKLVDHYSRKLC